MSRLIRIAIPAGIIALTFVALLTALNYGGSTSNLMGESDAMILWELPIAKLIFNIAAAGTIGTLVLTSVAMGPGTPEYRRALNFATASAAVWTLTSVASAVLAYVDVAPGVMGFDSSFGAQFRFFLTAVRLGQTWLVTTLIAATVTALLLTLRNIGSVAMVTVLAIGGMVPLTLNSHPNFGPAHDPGMAVLGLHIISAAVWLGGLMALAAIRPALSSGRLVQVVRRFSTLALFFLVVLAASGLLKAAIGIGTVENIATPYGFLVLAKAAALLVLGVAGFVQRRWLISRMESDHGRSVRYFWALVSAELLFLGVASGIATALARTDDPSASPSTYPMLAENMVGYRLPANPNLWHYLLETRFDPIWILLCVAGIFFYLAGVRRLHRSGESWPPRRTLFWLVGALALLYVSNGGTNAYRGFLFSAETITQMMVVALIPLLLVLGEPLVLADRAIQSRSDGSCGGREWIMVIVRSRLVAFATTPFVAAGVLSASLLVFSFPPLLEWSTTDQIGHQWMILYFLLVGSFFAASVIRPRSHSQKSFSRRLIAVTVVLANYVFLGVLLATSTELLQPDWYGAMARPWGVDPLRDQHAGGVVVLGIGTLQSVILAIVVIRTRYLYRSRTSSFKVTVL